jgi:hypothetical protein
MAMRTVGTHKERELSLHARGDLLKEGAQFNTEIQKLSASLRIPTGIYHYRSHQEADRHWMECIVATVVSVQDARHGRR